MNYYVVITDGVWDKCFTRDLEKKPRRNPLGEDIYLLPDGAIVRDEDKIIAVQRIWKERVYSPPGTPFAARGKMYRRALERFNSATGAK
jgi:hypothetical protein